MTEIYKKIATRRGPLKENITLQGDRDFWSKDPVLRYLLPRHPGLPPSVAGGCWTWPLQVTPPQAMRWDETRGVRQGFSVRRYIWAMWNGRALRRLQNLTVLCGNKRCINPEHLETGSLKSPARKVRAKNRKGR